MININDYKIACEGAASDLDFIFETNGFRKINLDYSSTSLIELECWYWNVIENQISLDCVDEIEILSDLNVRYLCKCLLNIGNTIKISKMKNRYKGTPVIQYTKNTWDLLYTVDLRENFHNLKSKLNHWTSVKHNKYMHEIFEKSKLDKMNKK